MNQKEQLLVIKKGDELITQINNYCQKKNIYSAWFSGLGAASSAKLAIYDLKRKKYVKKTIPGPLEITNISGNIGKIGEKRIIHCHATLSNAKMEAFAGHVDKLIISGTGEILILPLEFELIRQYDDQTGLNLLKGN